MKTLILVISIAGHPRRGWFSDPSKEFGVAWQFFDASTSLMDGLKHDEEAALVTRGFSLSTAELGCYSSHVRAWLKFIEDTTLDQLIVLEDDVVVDWNFLKELMQQDWASLGVDYLKLFSKLPAKFRVIAGGYPFFWRHLVEYTDLALGAQGYLLTRRGAQIFLRRLRSVVRPIDMAMDRPWSTGVRVVGILPVPVMEMTLPTTLGLKRFEKAALPARLRMRSYLYRGIEQIRRRLFSYLTPPLKIRRK